MRSCPESDTTDQRARPHSSAGRRVDAGPERGREPIDSDRLTDAEIRVRGWDVLVDQLGPSGALRFALLTERGHGDYATLRHRMLGALSVDDLLVRMHARRGGSVTGRRGTPRRTARGRS